MKPKLYLFLFFAFACISCDSEIKRNERVERAGSSTVPDSKFPRVLPLEFENSEAAIQSAKEHPMEVLTDAEYLLILGSNGHLLKADLDKKTVKTFEFARYVADLYSEKKDETYILTAERHDSPDWKIIKGSGEVWWEVAELTTGWEPVSKETNDRQQMIGMTMTEGRFVVLATRTIFVQQEDNGWKSVQLDGALQLGLQSPFAVTDDGNLYIGLNMGEWGGGLRRINLSTGKVLSVEKKTSGEICFSPLDSNCDPITSILKDQTDSNSILAGIGLMHMSQHGSVIRVKEAKIEVVFKRAYSSEEEHAQGSTKMPCEGFNPISDFDSYESDAVFGMKYDGSKLWIVTGRAVYRLFNGEIEYCSELPEKFENIEGLWISQSVPGVILVGTNLNWARSLSGTTPLLTISP